MTAGGAQQSNPYSTGGGGTNFETRVQAAFTLILLTGRLSPGLPPYPIHTLKLQGRYTGFHVDDFIAFARDLATGREAKLLAQIKHQVAMTRGDTVFGEVMDAAWRDFNDDAFNAEADGLALITGPLSAVDTRDVRPLLEWARHSTDEHEFLRKVATDQFGSDGKRGKLDVFRFHLGRANGGMDVTDAQLWSFLRRFHLIGYDLDMEGGSTHALLLSLIGQTSGVAPSLLWGRLVDAVQTANQNAGTITLETLPADIRAAFPTGSSAPWTQDLERLEEHGRYILDGIRTDIGGVHIDQEAALARLQALAQDSSFVWVTGPRGSGKSSLVRAMARGVGQDGHVFCLRTEDLNQSSLTQVLSALGVRSSLRDLGASLALLPKKYLFIESLEKVLELDQTGAFRDLLQFLRKHPGWTVVASGRHYAYQQIAFDFLQPAQVAPTVLDLAGFDEVQVEQLCEALDPLRAFSSNPILKGLLKSPFMADLAYRAVNAGANFTPDDGEREFRAAVWRDVIAKESARSDGMPARRRVAFVRIAVQRAKQMVYGVPEDDFDAEVISKLEEDHLILRDVRTHRLSPAHDVLEDWALEAFIDDAYRRHPHDVEAFLHAVGSEPAMNRAFRLWLQRELREGAGAADLILGVLQDPAVERHWQDEAMSAVLQSDAAVEFLRRLGGRLLEREGELLQRFCFVLRVSCMTPRFDMMPVSADSPALVPPVLLLRPFGSGWAALVAFALEHRSSLPGELRAHLAAVLKDWMTALDIHTPPPPPARELGLLALHLLLPLKEQYREDSVRSTLLDVVLKVAAAIPDEFTAMVEEDVLAVSTHRDRPAYTRDLLKKVFSLPGTAFVCASHPDLLIRLAWNEWVSPSEQEDDEGDGWGRSHADADGWFGLHNSRYEFFPASGAKGPFVYLLNRRGLQGARFILQLCNHAAERYARSGLEQGRYVQRPHRGAADETVSQIELRLNDGTVVSQYVSGRLWSGYRGHSVIPYVLQCALMALENWLIALVEDDSIGVEVLERVYADLLRNSNSVMTTAVLAAVATGFPDRLGRAALPLLRHPPLYSLDIGRSVRDRSSLEMNEFAYSGDPFGDLYAQERRTAARHPWRPHRLEHLLVQMQFSSWREEALAVVDELRTASTESDSERLLLHRVDTRGWTRQVDEERGRITFTTPDVEPDLAERQRQHQQDQHLMERFVTLFVWADRVFEGKSDGVETYPSWRAALTEARSLSGDFPPDTSPRMLHEGGLVTAAAVFLRDHLGELTAEEAEWCVDVTAAAALRDADKGDGWDGGSSPALDGVTAAASTLPLTLDLAHDEAERQHVRRRIVVALTHADSTVQTAAADGVRLYLWQRDPAFAERCVMGALEYGRFEHGRLGRDEFTDAEEPGAAQEERRTKDALREAWLRGDLNTELDAFSPQSHSGRHVLVAALMVPDGSTDAGHLRLLKRLLRLLFEEETRAADRRGRQDAIEIPFSQAQHFTERLATYLLSLAGENFRPFTDVLSEGCERAPSFINSLQLRVAMETERLGNKEQYWQFWNALSPRVGELAVQAVSEEASSRGARNARTLLRGLVFADMPWQKVDYDNQNIRLGKPSLLEFARRAGMNRDVFEGLASLIYHFPSVFFEDGVHLLADWQRGPLAPSIEGNSAFYVEVSIQRYLQVDHSGPISRAMYESCLVLLDRVVATASARAYYLREQLVRSRRVI